MELVRFGGISLVNLPRRLSLEQMSWEAFCEVFYNQFFSITMVEEKEWCL